MKSIRRIAASVAAAAALVVAVASPPAFAGTNVGASEAETWTSETGAGTTVVNDATASGGKALQVWDNVTVTGTWSNTSTADSLWLKMHTDAGTTAHFNLIVDGVHIADNASVAVTSWGGYQYKHSWTPGSHKVEVQYTSAVSTNLYIDNSNYATSAVAPETGSTYTNVYLTGYGWYDNTPAGSSTISNPQIHTVAGGTGTWADPVTVAVGHDLSTGHDVLDYPAGTRFYVPSVQKYFITEDTCGDGTAPQTEPCHHLYGNTTGQYAGQNAFPGASLWIDLWVGGRNDTSVTTSNACESNVTGTTNHTVIVNPSDQTYRVTPGDIATNDTTCQTGYGETPLH